MTTRLPRVLEHFRQTGGLTDGELLARFVAGRDEAAFAMLLQRHGPMVLGVCRRVLGHVHDAEDAFQATFLVLARKASAVVKRESVGSFLYGVAYRTTLEACTAIARRRAREKQVKDMPHPHVAPAEVPGWQPLLDRELSRLPEKYRAAIVLCTLEGRSRKEAARLLAVPEGTLSSRLAAGRQLLAKRLLRQGLALSGGALVGGVAPAPVPAALAGGTVRAAALVAAGQLTAATPPVVLMKGVMKAMLLDKLKVLVGMLMVAVAVGAVGFVCRPGGVAWAQPPGDNKPVSDVEALRKEVELLKLNNKNLLEKIGAQDKELVALKANTNTAVGHNLNTPYTLNQPIALDYGFPQLQYTHGMQPYAQLQNSLLRPAVSPTSAVRQCKHEISPCFLPIGPKSWHYISTFAAFLPAGANAAAA
jgi:RNA polymerase sigma factor (sigma-70 family)